MKVEKVDELSSAKELNEGDLFVWKYAYDQGSACPINIVSKELKRRWSVGFEAFPVYRITLKEDKS